MLGQYVPFLKWLLYFVFLAVYICKRLAQCTACNLAGGCYKTINRLVANF